MSSLRIVTQKLTIAEYCGEKKARNLVPFSDTIM